MTATAHSYKVEDYLPSFGINCPDPQSLQTGDLLFPRRAHADPRKRLGSLIKQHGESLFRPPIKERPIAEILSEFKVELLAKAHDPSLVTGRTLDITALIAEVLSTSTLPRTGSDASYSAELQTTYKLWLDNSTQPFKNFNSLYSSSSGTRILEQLLDPDVLQTEAAGSVLENALTDPRLLKLLMEILIAAGFDKLVTSWFGATLPTTTWWAFMSDPLIQLLLDLLVSTDVRDNVFVGHVGMVIREKNGKHADESDSKIYIIEGNINSYAHYRVAIHPYYIEAEEAAVRSYFDRHFNNPTLKPYTDFDLPALKTKGWANRRRAFCEYVWHARPRIMEHDGWQDQLINAAKVMHGRPYGFFDNPVFGDDDRMYCAEYIYNIFKRGMSTPVAGSLTDKMTWGHMQTSLKNDGNVEMGVLVNTILTDKTKYNKNHGDAFFVLPPALLWNGTGLDKSVLPLPLGEPYAPAIA